MLRKLVIVRLEKTGRRQVKRRMRDSKIHGHFFYDF